MFKEKLPYVRVFKLVTGEEIICKVLQYTDHGMMVENVLQIAAGEKGLQLVPYFFLADQNKSWELKNHSVLGESPGLSHIRKQYEAETSGIVVPEKKSLIIP